MLNMHLTALLVPLWHVLLPLWLIDFSLFRRKSRNLKKLYVSRRELSLKLSTISVKSRRRG